MSIITVQNCFNILAAAKLYRSKALAQRMYGFIGAHLDAIAKIDAFLSLSKADLSSCISAFNRSQIEQSSLFLVIRSWAKHGDEEERAKDFSHLLQLVKLEELSAQFLEDVVSVDELVTNNQECYALVMKTLVKLLKERKITSRNISSNHTTRIVSIGGFQNPKQVKEIYCLHDKSGPALPNLPFSGLYHCCLQLNDIVYCIGAKTSGRWGTIDRGNVWQINVKEKSPTWKEVVRMNQNRLEMGAAVHEETIIVAGGRSPSAFGTDLASVEMLRPAMNDNWKALSTLQQRRSGHALVSHDGSLYAIDGYSNKQCLSSVERLSGDLRGQWETVQPLQTPRTNLTSVSCKGFVYALGGWSRTGERNPSKSVERYDESLNQWTYVKDLNYARVKAAACVMNGKIFVVGGHNHGSNGMLRSMH